MPALLEPIDPNILVRDPRDDETYVMNAFEDHAARCPHCSDSLQSRALCARGRQHALDVVEYLYSEGGKHFSSVDRENGKSMRVRIPRDARAVCSLLAAVERGLNLRSSAVISYDRTYPVAPRVQPIQTIQPRSSRSPEPVREIIEREPASPTPKRRVIIYNSSPRSSHSRGSSRGSLYDVDSDYRVERRYESSRTRRSIEYHR